MKSKHRVLLFIVYIIQIVAAKHKGQITNLLENLNIHSDKKPLIVFLNTNKQPETTKDGDIEFNKLYSTEDIDDNDDDVFKNETEDEAKYMLYNLLRTGSGKTKEALRKALKKQCQAKVKCEKKCENSEEKKKDVYCPLNCKAVFDKLNLCDPEKESKKEKKKKKDDCDDKDEDQDSDDDFDDSGDCEEDCGKEEKNKCGGKRGKTMPPKWRF